MRCTRQLRQNPPWLFPMPVVDTQLYEEKHNKERSILTHIEVQQYIEQTYYSTVKIYTDGSKDPESGFTAAAVYIPQFKVKMSKRISDQISVFYYRDYSNIPSSSVDRRSTTNKISNLHRLPFSFK